MYCLSSLDEAVADELCVDLEGPAPPRKQRCLVPCADQCALSDWTEWTPCTATCGVQGGTQMRSREIIGQGLIIDLDLILTFFHHSGLIRQLYPKERCI